MKHFKYFNKFLSIILSLSLVVTSMPDELMCSYFLATPSGYVSFNVNVSDLQALLEKLKDEPDLYKASNYAVKIYGLMEDTKISLTEEQLRTVMLKFKEMSNTDIDDMDHRLVRPHFGMLVRKAVQINPALFEIVKKELNININANLSPSEDVVVEEFDNGLTNIRSSHGNVYSLLTNKKNLSNLIKLSTFLRVTSDPYFVRSKVLPPLAFALKNGLTFNVCDNIYITPITETFRRHILFTKNTDGGIDFVMELKVPGNILDTNPDEDRREIRRANFNVPKEMYLEHGESGGVIKPYFMLEVPLDTYEMYAGKFAYEKFPLRIVGYEYEDGKRAIYLDENDLKEIAKLNDISYDYLRTEIVEQLIRTVIRLFKQGWYGNTDMHLENFRVIVKDKKIKVVAVDFALFSKAGSDKARWHDLYTVLFLYNKFGFSDEEILSFIRNISLEMEFYLFEQPELESKADPTESSSKNALDHFSSIFNGSLNEEESAKIRHMKKVLNKEFGAWSDKLAKKKSAQVIKDMSKMIDSICIDIDGADVEKAHDLVDLLLHNEWMFQVFKTTLVEIMKQRQKQHSLRIKHPVSVSDDESDFINIDFNKQILLDKDWVSNFENLRLYFYRLTQWDLLNRFHGTGGLLVWRREKSDIKENYWHLKGKIVNIKDKFFSYIPDYAIKYPDPRLERPVIIMYVPLSSIRITAWLGRSCEPEVLVHGSAKLIDLIYLGNSVDLLRLKKLQKNNQEALGKLINLINYKKYGFLGDDYDASHTLSDKSDEVNLNLKPHGSHNLEISN